MLKFKKLAILVLFLFVLCCSGSQNIHNVNFEIEEPPPQPIQLYIDDHFSNHQQFDILIAINAWQTASDNKISFVPHLNAKRPGRLQDFYFEKYDDLSVFMWYLNLDDKNNINKDMYKEFMSSVGIWDKNGNVVILTDTNFYHIVLHELGHVLGLNHTDRAQMAVMHPASVKGCITELDAQQLCFLYSCNPKPECRSNIMAHK